MFKGETNAFVALHAIAEVKKGPQPSGLAERKKT